MTTKSSPHTDCRFYNLQIGNRYFYLHLAAIAAVIIFLSACGKKEDTVVAGPAPLEVEVTKVAQRDVPMVMEFVGQTKGAIDAEVRSRVEGVVTAIGFQEGKEVKEGQLLYSVDPAPYNAKVAEAQGVLAQAQTLLAKAESDLKRVRPLVKMKALSERDLDAAVAAEGAAKGSVDAAKASLESAQIQLGYCQITAPTTGIIGISKAKVGEFVGKAPNPVVLNTVSKLDPIHVRFSVNEKEYLYFARLKQAEIKSGKESVKRALELILADGSKFAEDGEVASVDREVDATTGSIAVEAAFPNPHQLIRPGQFAKIRTVAETVAGALVVPKRAIRDLQGQSQVFVVKPDNTVEQRTVTLGGQIEDQQIITTGLSAGDSIVVEGLQRMKSGLAVKPKTAS